MTKFHRRKILMWIQVASNEVDSGRADFVGNSQALNPPGRWDFFISHTRRHEGAHAIALKLHHCKQACGGAVVRPPWSRLLASSCAIDGGCQLLPLMVLQP